MADTPTPAPAAAGNSDARLSEADLLSALAQFGDDGKPDETEPPAAGEAQADTTDDEVEEPDAPEGEEGDATDEPDDGGEGEGPEDDASEPEQKEVPEKADDEDTKKVRLRDRTEVTLGDLKKGFDRAREFDQVLPKIQREFQEFQQAKQQFQVEKQQFDTLQQSIAQHALSLLPAEPDPALMDEASGKFDPIAYQLQQHRRHLAVESFKKEFSGVAQAQQQSAQKAQQEAVQRTQMLRQTAMVEFVNAHPELRDPEKGQAFIRDWNEVANFVGYSQEERGDILDKRAYTLGMLATIGYKSLKAEHQQKAVTTQQKSIAAKKVAAAPPVAAPAARQSAASRDARAMQASVERLRKNPSSTEAQLAAFAQFD